MTEKEYVEKVFSLNRKGTDGDKIDRDLQVIARELAVIADSLKILSEANHD